MVFLEFWVIQKDCWKAQTAWKVDLVYHQILPFDSLASRS